MSNEKKADFSGVTTKVDTTADKVEKDYFSGVTTNVDTPAEKVGSAEQTYTVQKGDTLSHISKQFYGKSSKWNTIFEANRDQLDDPDLIKPGQVLKIPAAEA